uniref:Growth hormone-inducible transmembrane protein n=1 Tax=Rhabditophanes sp. KR3021 TaxID=114890 RepID=A0AC35UD90_9BILA
MLARLLTKPLLQSSAFQAQRNFANSALQNARQGWRTASSTFKSATFTRTGPSLKERLLGPTSGKPYIYGSYAVTGAAVAGLGALTYYGLKMGSTDSVVNQSALWPQYVRDRLSTTYGYLIASLGVTAGSFYASSRTPAIMNLMSRGGILPFIAFMGAVIGSSMLCQGIDYHESKVAKHMAWMLHCGVMGALLCPLVLAGGPVLMRASLYTAGITLGLSTIALTAPSEKFLLMGGPLAMGLGCVLVANIGSMFLPPHSAIGAGLNSFVIYGGLILFAAYMLYNTQRTVKNAERPPGAMYYDQYGGAHTVDRMVMIFGGNVTEDGKEDNEGQPVAGSEIAIIGADNFCVDDQEVTGKNVEVQNALPVKKVKAAPTQKSGYI